MTEMSRATGRPLLGLDKLCQHNFENNRSARELRIIPRIIGRLPSHGPISA